MGSVAERAFLGDDLAIGAVRVHGSPKAGMSQALAALVANSTPLNVSCAHTRAHLREAILAGSVPLRPVRLCTTLPPEIGEPVEEQIGSELPESIEGEIAKEAIESQAIGAEPQPARVRIIDHLNEPSDGFLVRLAKIVGADRWLSAGTEAGL